MPTKSDNTRGPKLEPHQVVLRPVITEKGTHQSTHEHHNAYAFEVNLWADKVQIKHAVEELFGVRVLKVRTQMRQGKKRRYKFRIGKMSNWKKAVVKLHHEDKIEFY
jgi:large subunit ribosomal protein L23